jgi:hypothetical protein
VTTTINLPMMTRFLALARPGSFRRLGTVMMLVALVACGDTSPTPPRARTANCTVGATPPCACTERVTINGAGTYGIEIDATGTATFNAVTVAGAVSGGANIGSAFSVTRGPGNVGW